MSQENVQLHSISMLVTIDFARAWWNISYFSIWTWCYYNKMPLAKKVISEHSRTSLSYITHTQILEYCISYTKNKIKKLKRNKHQSSVTYTKQSADGWKSCSEMHRQRLVSLQQSKYFPFISKGAQFNARSARETCNLRELENRHLLEKAIGFNWWLSN